MKKNTLFQVLAMCPALAVTTSVINGVGMGLATAAALVVSNAVILLIRKFIPDSVKIPVYLIVAAAFVTVIQLLLKAYLPETDRALGIFIPLIVVNCMILTHDDISFADSVKTGSGFALILTVISAVREFTGNGSLFGIEILPETVPRTLLMILPPGAFISLGLLTALFNYIRGGIDK